MRPFVLLALAIVAVFGCSSSGPPSFTPVSERFTTFRSGAGMPDFTSTVTVRLADYDQGCPFKALDGGHELFVQVLPADAGTVTAGVFAVTTTCSGNGTACVDEDDMYFASKGTVTVTSLTASTFTGSYDVRVPLTDGSDSTTELSGGFNASFCSD